MFIGWLYQLYSGAMRIYSGRGIHVVISLYGAQMRKWRLTPTPSRSDGKCITSSPSDTEIRRKYQSIEMFCDVKNKQTNKQIKAKDVLSLLRGSCLQLQTNPGRFKIACVASAFLWFRSKEHEERRDFRF